MDPAAVEFFFPQKIIVKYSRENNTKINGIVSCVNRNLLLYLQIAITKMSKKPLFPKVLDSNYM